MTKDITKDHMDDEEAYFRKSDAEKLKKLQESARLQEIVAALADSLQVQNPELLRRVMSLGISKETGPAFLLAPLVQVAWAEGTVTDPERETVLRHAAATGIENGSPAQARLLEWLKGRPSDALFETAIEVLKAGHSVLTPDEYEARIGRLVQACREVSEASGGLAKKLGIGSGVSKEEKSILEHVTTALRSA